MFEISLEIDTEKINKISSAIGIDNAINNVFNSPSDIIIIKIADHQIKIPLVYSFSGIFDDFFDIVKYVNSSIESTGVFGSRSGIFGFRQNEVFDTDWELRWKENLLQIDFEWRKVIGYHSLELLPNRIEVNRDDFLFQWKSVYKEILGYLDDITFEYYDEYVELKEFID